MSRIPVKEMKREQQKAVFANINNQGTEYRSRDKYTKSENTKHTPPGENKKNDLRYAKNFLKNNSIPEREKAYYMGEGKTDRKPHGIEKPIWKQAYDEKGMTVKRKDGSTYHSINPEGHKKRKPSQSDVRDFFVEKSGTSNGIVKYSDLEKRFGKKNAYELHERGIIYEPIHGKAKMT